MLTNRDVARPSWIATKDDDVSRSLPFNVS